MTAPLRDPVASAKEFYLSFLDELPRTGADTLAGKMLRRYWHPVHLSAELKDIPVALRMLGEDLVLFRDGRGRPGLLGLQCCHRGASLEYGQVKEDGLMCSYHGWRYDSRGRCIDMPVEPEDSRLKQEVRQLWYPVEEWGGIIWTYMGPGKENPPPLPKIDVLDRTDGEIVLSQGDVRNYNYLNFLENFADMGHAVVLHNLIPRDLPEALQPFNDTSIKDWQRLPLHFIETDYGMKTLAVLDTGDPEVKFVNTWSIALPTYWRFSGLNSGLPPEFTDDRREGGGMIRIIDDTHCELIRYNLVRRGNFRDPCETPVRRGLPPGLKGLVEKKDYDHRKYTGWEGIAPLEDLVIQETQGAIPDRKAEHLGTSDRGVLLLRKIWREAMEDVASGKEPKNFWRQDRGVLEVDTFHGHIEAKALKIGPENLPSSKDGQGLIRDKEGKLVFA